MSARCQTQTIPYGFQTLQLLCCSIAHAVDDILLALRRRMPLASELATNPLWFELRTAHADLLQWLAEPAEYEKLLLLPVTAAVKRLPLQRNKIEDHIVVESGLPNCYTSLRGHGLCIAHNRVISLSGASTSNFPTVLAPTTYVPFNDSRVGVVLLDSVVLEARDDTTRQREAAKASALTLANVAVSAFRAQWPSFDQKFNATLDWLENVFLVASDHEHLVREHYRNVIQTQLLPELFALAEKETPENLKELPFVPSQKKRHELLDLLERSVLAQFKGSLWSAALEVTDTDNARWVFFTDQLLDAMLGRLGPGPLGTIVATEAEVETFPPLPLKLSASRVDTPLRLALLAMWLEQEAKLPTAAECVRSLDRDVFNVAAAVREFAAETHPRDKLRALDAAVAAAGLHANARMPVPTAEEIRLNKTIESLTGAALLGALVGVDIKNPLTHFRVAAMAGTSPSLQLLAKVTSWVIEQVESV